jgi:hypothetical protein
MARPPGDWDKAQRVEVFDLDESRKRGWRLDITFAAPDPHDGATGISIELDGFGWPDYLKPAGAVNVVRRVGGTHFSARDFDSVVGVLPNPDAPIAQVVQQVRADTFLVMGNAKGVARRTFRVPILHVVRSYSDDGR